MKRNAIAIRLAISFGFLLLIVLGLGWLGLTRMGRVNADLEEIVSKRWARVQSSREALRLSNLNNRITMELFILGSKEKIEPLLKLRAENSERISVLLDKLEENLSATGRERELLNRVKSTRTPYTRSYEEALRLLLEKNRTEQGKSGDG